MSSTALEDKFAPLRRYEHIIPGFNEFLKCLEKPLPKTVRLNTLKAEAEEIMASLEERGVEFKPLSWYEHGIKLLNVEKPGNLLEYFLGLIHPQEEVSMIPPVLMELEPGELVLDLCAAPGSKATQISQIMGNTGHVVANDVSLERISLLRDNYERLGVLNMSITMYDGRRFPLACQFDKVLVDVPCTCEGTARKSPEVLVRTPEQLGKRMSGLQKALLRKAYQLCRPGGRIVYASCTYAPEENEEVVSEILESTPGVTLEAFEPSVEYSPGLKQWNGRRFQPSMDRCVRIYPHQLDGPGFFIARLVKR